VHYQPQVRVDTGAVTGVEALIRWPQKDGTCIEPNDFIPVAEQRGLIRTIGAWVLREACRQNARGSCGAADVPVAVNLVAIQFRQKDFVATWSRCSRRPGSRRSTSPSSSPRAC
jgi:EAL domain-containing protein (putative c-di-GMP-specific phosphodiesterase class I)